LGNNEVLVVTGFECFSTYSGYGNTFKFEGNFEDKTKVEMTTSGPRRLSYMVAMDAIPFWDPNEQYTKEKIERELNKAYAAFVDHEE
jgi:poly(ADP-ribose) glycohydrolase